MKNSVFIISAAALFLLFSCNNSPNKGPSIDESKLVNKDINIKRYGKALFQLDTNNFEKEVAGIQKDFELFLGNDITNPQKLAPLLAYVSDTQLISISKTVNLTYPDISFLEEELSKSMSRFNYFFPEIVIPPIYTYISNLYYERPVIVENSAIIIALDVYLGPNFPTYRSLGLPYYKIRRMTSDNISIDVMKEMYSYYLDPKNKQKTLIDRMIEGGKMLYYIDAVLPNVPDSLKIGYTSRQMDWIGNNKENVWAFLVDNKLFYSADYKIQSTLIKDAPFTTGFSKESPPRIGNWLGWQIVRKYMDNHPEVSLKQLIEDTDYQGIFNKSHYKP